MTRRTYWLPTSEVCGLGRDEGIEGGLLSWRAYLPFFLYRRRRFGLFTPFRQFQSNKPGETFVYFDSFIRVNRNKWYLYFIQSLRDVFKEWETTGRPLSSSLKLWPEIVGNTGDNGPASDAPPVTIPESSRRWILGQLHSGALQLVLLAMQAHSSPSTCNARVIGKYSAVWQAGLAVLENWCVDIHLSMSAHSLTALMGARIQQFDTKDRLARHDLLKNGVGVLPCL